VGIIPGIVFGVPTICPQKVVVVNSCRIAAVIDGLLLSAILKGVCFFSVEVDWIKSGVPAEIELAFSLLI
jgi:hypothetical protein